MIPLTSAFTIAARTATALTTTATAMLTAPSSSQLYTITPGATGDVLDFSASATGSDGPPIMLLLDKTGSFAGTSFLNSGAAFGYLTPSTDKLYVVVVDDGGMGGYSANIVASDSAAPAVQTGGEGVDATNGVYTGATVLMAPPIHVEGATLSSATDLDYYAVTVPAGKAIFVQTTAGASTDTMTDTTVQFFDSTGVAAFGNADDPTGGTAVDDSYFENTASIPVTTAGTYYIAIGWSGESTYSATANTHYDLIVTLQ
jgi:hypothetical protein